MGTQFVTDSPVKTGSRETGHTHFPIQMEADRNLTVTFSGNSCIWCKIAPETIVRNHAHHAGCLKCGINVEMPTQDAARQWSIDHGRKIHGVEIEPVLTNQVCTLCAASGVN